MTSRIRLFDHNMKALTELSGIPTTPRRYSLNKWNTTEFSVGFDATRPQSAQKWSEKNFQYGNLIHIEHLPKKEWTLANKGKLPDWTGIILPDRNWELGVGQPTAYSIEALLQFRPMPHVKTKGTPATMFKTILNLAHARAGNIVIQYGTIDDLPIEYPAELKLSAYDEILDLISFAGMDWDVKGTVNEKGNLDLTANLYQRKGIDTPLILDSSNTELQGPLLSEQGTPSNHVFGYSDADTQLSRLGPLEGINQAAVDDYGPLQLNQVYQGKRDGSSVQRLAQNRADKFGRPQKKLKRIALDKGKTFDYLDVGNTMTVKSTQVGFHPNGGYGFESKVKILTMDYNDLSNKVVMNIEVL